MKNSILTLLVSLLLLSCGKGETSSDSIEIDADNFNVLTSQYGEMQQGANQDACGLKLVKDEGKEPFLACRGKCPDGQKCQWVLEKDGDELIMKCGCK